MELMIVGAVVFLMVCLTQVAVAIDKAEANAVRRTIQAQVQVLKLDKLPGMVPAKPVKSRVVIL